VLARKSRANSAAVVVKGNPTSVPKSAIPVALSARSASSCRPAMIRSQVFRRRFGGRSG
jgi:hypothetical protein